MVFSRSERACERDRWESGLVPTDVASRWNHLDEYGPARAAPPCRSRRRLLRDINWHAAGMKKPWTRRVAGLEVICGHAQEDGPFPLEVDGASDHKALALAGLARYMKARDLLAVPAMPHAGCVCTVQPEFRLLRAHLRCTADGLASGKCQAVRPARVCYIPAFCGAIHRMHDANPISRCALLEHSLTIHFTPHLPC